MEVSRQRAAKGSSINDYYDFSSGFNNSLDMLQHMRVWFSTFSEQMLIFGAMDPLTSRVGISK